MSALASARTQRRPRRKRSPGWVPNQHGAWAMLTVPYLIGVALTIQHDRFRWYVVPLLGCWMIGYFCFHATSQWLKSRRAARFVPPMLTYGVIAALFGVLTWTLAGWALAGWVLVYTPILAFALHLAAARRERDLIGGLLTVAAAALILLVVTNPDPRTALADRDALPLALICFGYFAGTVWVVKTMIRERGKPGWVAASIGWHLVATLAAAVAAASGNLSWLWAGFFAATTVRATVLPLFWPMRGRVLSAARIGIIEIVFSAVLLVSALTIGVG
ncbi:YwiC-like family protein [Enemella sp. A6]|uniref:YwiC-like family protein n=1 Tax=Enemella sp. A6 TaxID=3440152 RepID=UPI003EC1414E